MEELYAGGLRRELRAALPTKAAQYGSAKTFVALPSLAARCQQNQRIRILRMGEVSAYGACQPDISKKRQAYRVNPLRFRKQVAS
jgi:hypothetical protein